jgi:hypothetical protein
LAGVEDVVECGLVDFAGACQGHLVEEDPVAGAFERGELLGAQLGEFVLGRGCSWAEAHERRDLFAEALVRDADDGGERDGWVVG